MTTIRHPSQSTGLSICAEGVNGKGDSEDWLCPCAYSIALVICVLHFIATSTGTIAEFVTRNNFSTGSAN
jgi:hypothetical protein